MLDAATAHKNQRLVRDAETYARDAFGAPMDLVPFFPETLPHFLLDRYSFFRGSLLGRPAIFMALAGQSLGAVGDFLKHREMVRMALSVTLVILLLDVVPAPLRRRLVEKNIAFLSPGAQLYIPEILLDLRDVRTPVDTPTYGKISPTAQILLLAALLGQAIDDVNQTALARRYRVAIMSISRALDELGSLGLAEARLIGRQRRVRLSYQGGELWRAVEPRLQSPVRKLRLISGDLPRGEGALAGESALAHYTMLAEPKVERRAVSAAAWSTIARRLDLRLASIHDEDRIELETWSYDPFALTRESLVDRLSLYLSVRHNPDERVAQAAQQLLEPFGW